MISISIFRINAKNRTIWYNLIQTSVPLAYTNYFYNIYCPNMGGSRGGTGGPPPPELPGYLLFVFAMLKFSVRPLLGIWTPLPPPGIARLFVICFCHVEIFRQTPSGNSDPPPLGKFSGSAHAKHDLSESFFQYNYFPC